jgi:hypothetical protein
MQRVVVVNYSAEIRADYVCHMPRVLVSSVMIRIYLEICTYRPACRSTVIWDMKPCSLVDRPTSVLEKHYLLQYRGRLSRKVASKCWGTGLPDYTLSHTERL